MNLVNYLQTPPYRVLETIKSEAARWGTTVTSTEIVGLVPNEALINVARWYLMLENFDKDQVLEIRLDNALEAQASSTGLKSFIDTVASSAPAPGGGSVSAVAGSLAGALGAMVCRLTIGKKQYAEVQERMSELLKKTDTLKEELNTLVKKDADSFDAVMAAMKLPKDTDEQKQKRQEEIQQATIVATKIPLEVMRHSLETIKLAAEIAEIGNVNSVSDAGVGALMGRTAVEGAYYNVMINLPGIEDREIVDKIKTEAESILAQAEESVKLARRIVVEKIR